MKNLKKKLLSAGVVLSITLGASFPVFANNYSTSDYTVPGNQGNWTAYLRVKPGEAFTATTAKANTAVAVYTRCTASNGNTLNAFTNIDQSTGMLYAITNPVNGTAWWGYHTVYDPNGTVHASYPLDGEFWH